MRLDNERLHITFAEPKEVQTQRFDHSAIVKQVILDDQYAFCTPEQVIAGQRTTNGIGLCGEFVLDGAAEAVRAGEWFCKPGVGMLRQTEDHKPYDMWQVYEIRPFTVEVRHREKEMIFRQKAIICGGYGIDIEKAFRLEGNRLILDIFARNAGRKSCVLQEYQHNFLSLENNPVGPGYVLQVPCDGDLKRIEGRTLLQGDERPMPSAVRVQDDRVHWAEKMDRLVLYHRSENVRIKANHMWKMQHVKSKISVQEQVSFCPSRIDVWAVEHCICPEFYHRVQLAPGELAHWRRTWTFYGEDD